LKTIEIVVSPSGETRLETKGFAGTNCRMASDLLERALGQTTGEQVTSEFYTTVSTVSPQQQQQGP
jgi:hypothetical protein